MKSELRTCLKNCRGALGAVALLSGGSNILALTGSIFMLAVYDRVIPSSSIPSLVAIGLIALGMYAMQAVVDILRQRILTRIGLVIRESFAGRIYSVMVRNAALGNHGTSTAVNDLDQIQAYLSSLGPTALFDLPWLPFYLAICFAFHPLIGYTVLAGAVVLIVISYFSNLMTKEPSQRLSEWMGRRNSFLIASQMQSETIHAMGMTLAMSGKWRRNEDEIVERSRAIADTATLLGTLSRVFRISLQSLVLAVGAYLVIMQEATGGIMIAGSILSARALSPIEQAIAHWKNLVAARQSWHRLGELFDKNPPEKSSFATPAPTKYMACNMLSLASPQTRELIVRDVSVRVDAGTALGIVGTTGSGKSSLARGIVGLWPPAVGGVYMDGIPLSRWPSFDRGRFIGYLPQNVILFDGTIAQNIARFDPTATPEQIVDAARKAGVHELVSRMPDGYDTRIGAGGTGLSGGQAQRVGLARALFGDPFMVVLDEPNSNLDAEGEQALFAAINSIKARGGILILVTHRLNILSLVEQVLIMQNGRVKRVGTRDEVFETPKPQPPRLQPGVVHDIGKPRLAAVNEAGGGA